MAINKSYKSNFETLHKAVKAGDVVLVECSDSQTGKPVIAVCAINREEDETVAMVPLAKMFDGNPYEELNPPT